MKTDRVRAAQQFCFLNLNLECGHRGWTPVRLTMDRSSTCGLSEGLTLTYLIHACHRPLGVNNIIIQGPDARKFLINMYTSTPNDLGKKSLIIPIP